jgi:peptidoglycan/LPS O-acetylase OafA/YrhL
MAVFTGESHKFVALDGLRGIAALAVVLYHEGHWIDGDQHIKHGYLAVDFFFALSGFVLAHAYWTRLQNDLTTLQFMKLRLLRLFPLFLAGWIIGGAYYVFAHNEQSALALTATLLFQLAFLPVLSEPPMVSAFPVNPPGWSLFFELLANFVYGAVSLVGRFAFLSICVVSAVLLAGFVKLHGANPGWSTDTLIGGIPRVIYEFFAGFLIYQLYERKRLTQLVFPIAIPAILLLVLLCLDFPAANFKYYLIAAIVCMPLLLAVAASSRPEGSTARLCAWLGYISYGVYVLHHPIFNVASALAFPSGAATVEHPIFFVVVLAVVIAAAHILTSKFDEPLRKYWHLAVGPKAKIANVS